MKWFRRHLPESTSPSELHSGLEKTRLNLWARVERLLRSRDRVDEAVLDELEETLIESDVGVATTLALIDRLQARARRDRYASPEELWRLLREETLALLGAEGQQAAPRRFEEPLPHRPYVIMVVGVNGVGKTTTIGKLAWAYRKAGRSVLLGAADTFRAAAIEQLEVWAQRAGVPVIKHHPGADPGAVAFDAVSAARARGAEVAIIDTAGRLHTKGGLMEELAKVRRAMAKALPTAPNEVLLVLDATTGQNGLRQAEEFARAVQVTGLVLTKLDGTAKGGVVLGIAHSFGIPVRYLGVGERLDDLLVFDPQAFVEALFADLSLRSAQ
ncbi:MAG: signal recognition particle-docking protein FtsY [Bacteroidetes bacterium]|nr:signal recognition particle-docking protein FtsY [Rhodothermia bacterium]MCS7155377.1 signal recognition particle-docking protein FtsY [Bacteroidota bacterium]MCX7907530.1 signal recognition particle-docking protein FtsY [Bacteroidota bacterium]MDW8138524.1 signal recognition particle-docking protein FtsY [Bacteroidota bacterium]MDW8284539.1 signal recognition particle-docking protein FtsY [Bacteroidota bacterium]